MTAIYLAWTYLVVFAAMQAAGIPAIWIQRFEHVVVLCSLAHNFLPPWDFLADFPTAMKIYRIFIYLVGYVALNGRSTIYRQLSTQNGTVVSPVVANGKVGNGGSQAPANQASQGPVPPPPAAPPKN